MGRLRSYKCPECAAPLRIDVTLSNLSCTYCGHRIMVEPEAPAVDPAPVSTPPPAAPPRARMALMLLPTLLVLGASAGVSYYATRGTANKDSWSTRVGVVPRGEHMQWVAHADAPVAAMVNGDEIEDVVGQHRVLELGASVQSSDFIGAFDGATLKRIWQAGPFGKPQDIHFAVAGARVLVTDDHASAHVLELSTGKVLATVALTDVAKRVCADDAGFDVDTVDDKFAHVDLTGKLASRPASGCGARPACCGPCYHGTGDFEPSARCIEKRPVAPGMRIERTLDGGGTLFSIGQRSPGTATPMVAGHDTKAGTLRWSRLLPTVDATTVKATEPKIFDLRDGMAYVQYELDKGARLAAIDVRSGETRWDTIIPRSEEGSEASRMRVSAQRVYLPHWTWLDVFDRQTGAVVGTIGRW